MIPLVRALLLQQANKPNFGYGCVWEAFSGWALKG